MGGTGEGGRDKEGREEGYTRHSGADFKDVRVHAVGNTGPANTCIICTYMYLLAFICTYMYLRCAHISNTCTCKYTSVYAPSAARALPIHTCMCMYMYMYMHVYL